MAVIMGKFQVEWINMIVELYILICSLLAITKKWIICMISKTIHVNSTNYTKL